MDINLTYNLTEVEVGRIRITVSLNEEVELGTLYFEKAKRGFTNKPISMDAWLCVDAKIEKLYEISDYEIFPKEIVEVCQKMIKNGGV